MLKQIVADHGNRVNPDVDGITCTAQVRLVELITLGPAKWSIDQTFLHYSMEPGQQEVQVGSLHWSLHINTENFPPQLSISNSTILTASGRVSK